MKQACRRGRLSAVIFIESPGNFFARCLKMINTPRCLLRVPAGAEAANEISMNIVGVVRAIRIDRRNNSECTVRADYVSAEELLTRGQPTRGFEFFRQPVEVYRQSSYRGRMSTSNVGKSETQFFIDSATLITGSTLIVGS